jgi:hypothetical protein
VISGIKVRCLMTYSCKRFETHHIVSLGREYFLQYLTPLVRADLCLIIDVLA